MKYLKYILICMVTLFLVPRGVNATQTVDYKEYKVGDEITVWLDVAKTKTAKFRVIANSAAGRDTKQPDGKITPNKNATYQWVTAIYEGTVGESAYRVASEDDLTYEHSALRPNLVAATKDWKTPDDIRLLTLNDLATLLGNSVPTYISTHLKDRYPWMVSSTSYWLEKDAFKVSEQVVEGTTTTTKSVIVAYAITPAGLLDQVNETTKAGIRPVITIHKGFVEGGMICTCEDCDPKVCPNKPEISIQACLDEGNSESVCIERLCKDKEEPKVCPNKPEISIQACLDEGNSESVCIEKLCKDKEEPKVCPNKPEISIQACLDEGNSESVCIEKLCKGKEKPKVCPNKPEISIQDCIDAGKSEEVCIKEKCADPKPDNPKTGAYISIGVLLCGAIAGVVYFIINKKKYFSKI